MSASCAVELAPSTISKTAVWRRTSCCSIGSWRTETGRASRNEGEHCCDRALQKSSVDVARKPALPRKKGLNRSGAKETRLEAGKTWRQQPRRIVETAMAKCARGPRAAEQSSSAEQSSGRSRKHQRVRVPSTAHASLSCIPAEKKMACALAIVHDTGDVASR